MTTVRAEHLDELRSVTLFSDLPPDVLERLTEGALLQRFPKETVLFEQGQTPDFLHVLLEGSVQMIAAGSDGREALVEIVTPVDVFILAAALTDTPCLMSAKVNEAARILMIPAHGLRQQILADPTLAVTMLASLAAQFRRMVRQIKNLKLRTAVQRAGCYIHQLASENAGASSFKLPYDKQLIASHLGMTRESLSRALAQLRDAGVHTRGDIVVVDDLRRLEAFCRPDRLIDGVESELRIRPD